MREKLLAWADYFAAIALALWAAAGILFLLGNQAPERLGALGVLGALFLAAFVYLKFAAVRQAVTSRSARYGSNALLVSIAFILIVGGLNFLGARYHYRYDATEDKSFTLDQATIQVLQDLKVPVQAVAFFTQIDPARQEVEDRLREYVRITDKFTYRFVDPDAEPQIANAYKVPYGYNVVIFERGERRENAYQTDEQTFTNAIYKVSQDTQPVVYFTTGHGERSPEDSTDNGYSSMKLGIERSNYKTALIDLKTVTDTLPSDMTTLVIAGPRQPFEPAEAKLVKDYLDAKGRVLMMLDPQTESGLDAVLKDWGVRVRNDVLYDTKFGTYGQAQIPVINAYGNHKITQDLTGQSTFFPGVRTIEILSSAPPTRTVTSLFKSSDNSWGETDFASIQSQTAKFDDKADAKGPLDLAIAAEAAGDNSARLVVVGNSLFVTNKGLQTRAVTASGQQMAFGNGLLYFNMLNWLAGQENLITVASKSTMPKPVFLTAEEALFVFWSSFLLVPATILLIGVLVWWRRR